MHAGLICRVLPGDSGGPLLYLKSFWSLVGVSSWTWGEETEQFGRYNAFVNVKIALPWIEETLRELDDLNCKPPGHHDN